MLGKENQTHKTSDKLNSFMPSGGCKNFLKQTRHYYLGDIIRLGVYETHKPDELISPVNRLNLNLQSSNQQYLSPSLCLSCFFFLSTLNVRSVSLIRLPVEIRLFIFNIVRFL